MTRDTLPASLAHDLKTPLAVIAGYAELLRDREDESIRREAPLRILEAAQRLAAEIEALLARLVEIEEIPDRAGALPACRIVLVDDDPTLRGLLRATLPEDEYDVLEAGDAASALATLEREAVDLVVLDWRLPDGTGGQVLEQVKARWPELPVIVLTAEAYAEAGAADAFLTKPFSPLHLLDEVERLLGRA